VGGGGGGGVERGGQVCGGRLGGGREGGGGGGMGGKKWTTKFAEEDIINLEFQESSVLGKGPTPQGGRGRVLEKKKLEERGWEKTERRFRGYESWWAVNSPWH